MVFKKLFQGLSQKPWTHSDPNKRLAGLKTLVPDNAEHQQLFIDQLAAETSTEIQLWLLSHIFSPGVLAQYYQQNKHQDHIQHCLWQLSLSQDLQPQADYNFIFNANSLSAQQLTQHSQESQTIWLQQACILLCQNQKALAQVALQDKNPQTREIAVQGINDREHLLQLQKSLANKDKNTYRIVKNKLKSQKQQQQLLEQLLLQLDLHTQQCCEHSKKPADRLYAATWQHLDNKVSAVKNQLLEFSLDLTSQQQLQKLEAQLALAKTEYLQRQDNFDQQQLAVAQQQKIQDDACKELTNTLTALDNTIEQLQSTPEESLALLPNLTSELKLQHIRWQQASKDYPPTAEQKIQFAQHYEKLYALLQACERFHENQTKINELLTQTNPTSIKRCIDNINWPKSFPLPAKLEELYQAVDHAIQRQALDQHQLKDYHRQTDNKLNELEQALTAGNIKAAGKLRQQLRQQFPQQQPMPQHWHRLKQLEQQLGRYNSWQHYAETPKKNDLCIAMECLAESTLNIDVLAEKIKRLQEQFKDLNVSGNNKDQKIWQRFHLASEIAYAPCKLAFEKKRQLEKQYESQRVAICTELETYIANIDWQQVDWQKVEQLHNLAKQQWRDCGQIDPYKYRKLNQRFLISTNTFRDQLKQQRDHNVNIKQLLIKDTALLMDEDDLSQAMNQCKNFQAQWKLIGITPYKLNQQLWQDFRKACDQVFQRRDLLKQQDKAQHRQQLNQGRGYIDSIKSELNRAQIKQIETDFKSLPGTIQAQLNHAFEAALQQHSKASNDAKSQQQKRSMDDMADQAKLCHQLEQLVLNKNFNNAQEFAAAQPQPQQALRQRWQQALKAAQQQQSANLDQLCQDNHLAYQNQCIQLEINAGLSSPQEFQQQRLALQVQQLQQGFGRGEKSPHQQANDNLDLLQTLFSLGPISAELFSTSQGRIKKARLSLSL